MIRCITIENDDDFVGQLTSRSCKDDDGSAHLFSNIINEGRLGGKKRRSAATTPAGKVYNIYKYNTWSTS